MTLTRKCDACGKPIVRKLFLDIGVAVKKTEGSEYQDSTDEVHGDYCDACARNGAAIKDLLGALKQT